MSVRCQHIPDPHIRNCLICGTVLDIDVLGGKRCPKCEPKDDPPKVSNNGTIRDFVEARIIACEACEKATSRDSWGWRAKEARIILEEIGRSTARYLAGDIPIGSVDVSEEISEKLGKITMEAIQIYFDDFRFDTIVHAPNALPDDGFPEFIFKDKGATKGKPLYCIAFNAKMPDGKIAQCQTVVTAKFLLALATAIRGRYPEIDRK